MVISTLDYIASKYDAPRTYCFIFHLEYPEALGFSSVLMLVQSRYKAEDTEHF